MIRNKKEAPTSRVLRTERTGRERGIRGSRAQTVCRLIVADTVQSNFKIEGETGDHPLHEAFKSFISRTWTSSHKNLLMVGLVTSLNRRFNSEIYDGIRKRYKHDACDRYSPSQIDYLSQQHQKTRLSIRDWRTSTEVLHKAVRRPDPEKISLSLELAGFVWL